MLRVLRQRDFSLLWFAGLISMTGDWMLGVALPITVYDLTGSALATGGLLIANRLSAVLLGSFAGVLVDRWDRKQVMVTANLIRAPLLMPLLAVDSADRVWIVYIAAAALSAVGQFFRPAENALLPKLIDQEHLVPANALNSLNDNLARLAGPALGGVVTAWLGLRGVALVDAATFLAAAVMIGAIAAQTRAERVPATDGTSPRGRWQTIWHEWRDGLRLIRGNPVLRVVISVFGIASFGEGVFQTGFWAYVDQALDGGAREAGWLLSAQAIGGLTGAMVIGSRFRSRSPVHLLAWGSIGLGSMDLLLFNYPAFVPGIWPGLVCLAIGGLPGAAFGTGYTSAIQLEASDAYRGRVFGALLTTSALLMMLGALLAGVAMKWLGPVAVLTVDSLGYIAGGVFALWSLGIGAIAQGQSRQPGSV